MVLHAGVYYFTGPVLFYNSVTKEIIEFEIEKKIWRIHDAEEIFNLIKIESAEKELGCCCICLSKSKFNEDRSKLINIAQDVGFKKVRIIDGYTAFYLSVISQITYKPVNDDIIWLYTGAKWYTWLIDNNKASVISIANINDLKTDINTVLDEIGSSKIPTVILYNDSREFDEILIKKTFPDCQIFSYKQGNYLGRKFESMKTYIYPEYCNGALVKARVMGKDPDAMKCNVNAVVMKKINAYINKNKSLLFFEMGEKLTAKKSKTFKTFENYNILKIGSSGFKRDFLYCLQINKIYDLRITMEKNEIYDINLECHPMQSKIMPKCNYFFPKTATIPYNFRPAYIVGVNLGNTRCCAAVIRRNGIETVALDNTGERLLPCYVGYDENHVIFGNLVFKKLYEQMARENPQISTAFDAKKIIGKKLSEINIAENWPFRIVQDASVTPQHLDKHDLFQYELLENNDIFFKMETKNGELFMHPEEVIAALLKLIREKVDEYQGLEHSTVMITVPFSFNDSQKTSIYAAAVCAGWDNVSLIPESVAVAFSHLMKMPRPKDEAVNLVIFDLGGTTLNVSVAAYKMNQFIIIGHAENPNLGGINFDNVLVDYFATELKDSYGIIDMGKKRYKLYFECLKIKEHLSEHEETSLEVDEIFVSIEAFIDITRSTFEEISKPLLENIKLSVMKAVEKSSLKCDEISQVIFVGGGSRMPMIRNLLKNIFPNATQQYGKHPDEIIAIGAAHYANYLNSNLKGTEKFTSLKTRKRKNTSFGEIEDDINDLKKQFELTSL